MVGVFLGGRPPSAGPPQSDPKTPATDQEANPKGLTAKLIEAHNRVRKVEKLPPLSPSRKLQAAAEIQALDMADHSKMTHEGSDGSTVVDRVKDQKYEYRRVGENVACGQFSIRRVMEGWMKSPAHRRNILGGYSQIGAACATDKDGMTYWCVTFGLPRSR